VSTQQTTNRRQINALKRGFLLHWYEIKSILGQGGFGITYLAYDKNLAHEVAIKEYVPVELSGRGTDNSVVPFSPELEQRYRWGLERFIEEARTLGHFKHPSIVSVRNVFEANNTAYMVMDYELGESLQDILTRRKVMDEADIRTTIFPIIEGVKLVHAHGFVHRDIKPANIFVRVDGEPVLLDFGSARQAMVETHNAITSVFSKGYAPIEQYQSEEEQQGPWTDIYALGATLYRAITGIPPVDAIDRSSSLSMSSRDPYVPAMEVGKDRYSPELLKLIDDALRFNSQDRPQTMSEWLAGFNVATDAAAAQPDVFNKTREQAEQGDLDAQASLGFMYAKGVNTEINKGEAVRWYEMAAKQGHVTAQFNLGVMHAQGRGVQRNYREASYWYAKAAEQGDAEAQAILHMLYSKGIGVEKNDQAAFEWCRRAAEGGHLNACFRVGGMYWKGVGVEQDPEAAFQWFKRAAERGHISAQIMLAYLYGKGQGVARNDIEAYHWYRRAAEAGNPHAQYNLGLIYAKGRGIDKNPDEARKWYGKAAEQGNERAQNALARLG
jgi:TPR repeat protein/tRNA A-37 threonylcarbamoyl transferase component Bud32